MVLMCPLPWMIFGSTNKFKVIIENIRRMADNEIFCQPFVFLIYTCKYSFTVSKHGHPFIGFKSRCPTINAFGNCLRNSLNKASNEPFAPRYEYPSAFLPHPARLRSKYLPNVRYGSGNVPQPFRATVPDGFPRHV